MRYLNTLLLLNDVVTRSSNHVNRISKNAVNFFRSLAMGVLLFASGALVAAPFNFATEAPANFNYSLSTLSVPSISSQFVATTQGALSVSNGAASYNIAIDLPPAVRNLKPNLSLSYNSRAGNGVMGVGWSLNGLSTISRCRASVATEGYGSSGRYTASERLCLDGQKLVLASTAIAQTDTNYWAAGAEFKTEIDSFAKVVAYSSGASRYYKVFTKDNRILTFGEEANAQNSRIYAPGRAGGPISIWALDKKVEDAYGNNYTVTYERDTANGDYRPLRINFSPEAAVVFNYQTRAGQNPWGYDMGYKFMHTKVLDSVVTYINVVSPTYPEGATPVKKYDVNYKISPGTQRELVDTISECGATGASWQCAKPLTFQWQAGAFGFETNPYNVVYCGGGVFDASQFVDLDEDGYVDALPKDGIVGWGTAQGCFERADWLAAAALGVSSYIPVKTTAGYELIVNLKTGGSGVALKYGRGYISNINRAARTFTYREDASLSYSLPGLVVAADTNNDGIQEVYETYGDNLTSQLGHGAPTNTRFMDIDGSGELKEVVTTVNYDDPRKQYGVFVSAGIYWGNYNWDTFHFEANTTQRFNAGSAQVGNPILLNGGQFGNFIDFNGDGLKDYLFNQFVDLYEDGYWYYRVNNQNGLRINAQSPAVGERVSTGVVAQSVSADTPTNHYSYAYDYDKDGREDLVAVVPGTTLSRVLLSRDINGELRLQEAKNSQGALVTFDIQGNTPNYDEALMSIFIGDVNNDGIADMNYRGTITLGKTQQPDLLTGVTDGFGAWTNIEYNPLSSQVYTPDTTKPIFPQAPVNRSMQVVRSVSTSSGFQGANTRYFNYVGGKQDLQGRGFLGFTSITVTDNSIGLVTTTNYLQKFPYIGRVSTAVTKATNGNLISSVRNIYQLHPQNNRFPYLWYTSQDAYQLTSPNLYSGAVSESRAYNTFDACGNLITKRTEVGLTNYYAPIPPLSVQVTTNDINTYGTADCGDDFIYRQTETVTKVTTNESKTAVTEFTPNAAKEVASKSIYKGTALETTTTYGRELNGVINGIQVDAKDINGAALPSRITTYSNFVKGIFPQTSTDVLAAGNHVTTLAYDYRFGEVKKITTPNLQMSSKTFDSLGRVDYTQQNDGTDTGLSSFYCAGATITCPYGALYGVATRSTHYPNGNKFGAPVSIVFYNFLQQEIRRSVYGLNGTVVNTDTRYYANGRVDSVSEPYTTQGNISGSGASRWTSYSNYDELGRARTIVGPDGGSKTIAFTQESGNLKVTENVTVKSANSTDVQTTSRYINPLGQVIKVVDALNIPVNYEYDSAGNLVKTQVNNDYRTAVVINYDLAGNKSYLTDPDAGPIQFDYNGFGEMCRQTWRNFTPDFKSITYSFDQLGRQTAREEKVQNTVVATYNWLWDTKQKGMLSSESG
jgi:YD repeat-containing protein